MKQETERFFTKIEQKFKRGQVSITEFENMINEWRQLIAVSCYEQQNMKQTYLNLNHLKLTVQWFRHQHCSNKCEQLKDFLQYMLQYLNAELQSLAIYSEDVDKPADIKGTQSHQISWTGKKRDLIELIYSLKEAKCINSGKVSLQQSVVLFESIFNVELNNFHAELSKMAARKPLKDNIQRAYFLNDLADRFNDKMLKK
jgi:hypothetical protein